MTTSTHAYPPASGATGGAVTLQNAGGNNSAAPRQNFIPMLWSDEVVASYKSNLVVANLVSLLNHNGKKGDAINIPAPNRGSAQAKSAGVSVTLQYATENQIQVLINKHFEYSRLIEDIVSVQALPSLRKFYVDDAGYALAVRVDQDITSMFHYLNAGNVTPAANNLYQKAVIGSDGSTTFLPTANTNTGNGAALTDAGIRKMIQTLDDNDVPLTERFLIIPPVEKKNLTGIPRFTEQAFVGEAGSASTMRTGLIGDVYGIPVYVSTNCPWIHTNSFTGTVSVTYTSSAPTGGSFSDFYGLTVDWSTSSPTDKAYRVGSILHRSALVLIEQMSVRTQTQYKQEYLADLLTADTIYGVGRLRDGGTGTQSLPTAGVAFVVAS